MKKTIKKLKLIKEVLSDWKNGNLSDRETLMVIGLVLKKQPNPSKKATAKIMELIEEDNNKEKHGKKS